jgi:hypothetical protein
MEHEQGLQPIIKRLEKYYDADQIYRWLTTPHPQLPDYKDALECILLSGDFIVHEVLDRLDADAYL